MRDVPVRGRRRHKALAPALPARGRLTGSKKYTLEYCAQRLEANPENATRFLAKILDDMAEAEPFSDATKDELADRFSATKP